MKRKLGKILLKWLMVLAGVLLIISAVEFAVWCNKERIASQIKSAPMEGDWGEIKAKIFERVGFDRFFIPSFWPFQERYYRE